MSSIIELRIPVQTEIEARVEIKTDLTQFNTGVAETIRARVQALGAPILMDEPEPNGVEMGMTEPDTESPAEPAGAGRLQMLDGGQVQVLDKPEPQAAEEADPEEEEPSKTGGICLHCSATYVGIKLFEAPGFDYLVCKKCLAKITASEPEADIPEIGSVWRERANHDVTAVVTGPSGTAGLNFKRLTCPLAPHLIGVECKDFIKHFGEIWEPTGGFMNLEEDDKPKRKRRTKAEMEADRAAAAEVGSQGIEEPRAEEVEPAVEPATEPATDPEPSAAGLSSIIRVGDHFEKRADQRIKGKAYDSIRVLEVDHDGKRVRTEAGWTNFSALDQFYQLADGMPRGACAEPMASEPAVSVAPDPAPKDNATFEKSSLAEVLVPGDVIRAKPDAALPDGYPAKAVVISIDDSGVVIQSGDVTGKLPGGIINTEYERAPAAAEAATDIDTVFRNAPEITGDGDPGDEFEMDEATA